MSVTSHKSENRNITKQPYRSGIEVKISVTHSSKISNASANNKVKIVINNDLNLKHLF